MVTVEEDRAHNSEMMGPGPEVSRAGAQAA